VAVELMDAHENKQLWGATYDRASSDLVAAHQELAAEVAQKLRVELTPARAGAAGAARHGGSRGVPAVPAGPVPLERAHGGCAAQGDRILPGGDRPGPGLYPRLLRPRGRPLHERLVVQQADRAAGRPSPREGGCPARPRARPRAVRGPCLAGAGPRAVRLGLGGRGAGVQPGAGAQPLERGRAALALPRRPRPKAISTTPAGTRCVRWTRTRCPSC
jgi:hypothetical protein